MPKHRELSLQKASLQAATGNKNHEPNERMAAFCIAGEAIHIHETLGVQDIDGLQCLCCSERGRTCVFFPHNSTNSGVGVFGSDVGQ